MVSCDSWALVYIDFCILYTCHVDVSIMPGVDGVTLQPRDRGCSTCSSTTWRVIQLETVQYQAPWPSTSSRQQVHRPPHSIRRWRQLLTSLLTICHQTAPLSAVVTDSVRTATSTASFNVARTSMATCSTWAAEQTLRAAPQRTMTLPTTL